MPKSGGKSVSGGFETTGQAFVPMRGSENDWALKLVRFTEAAPVGAVPPERTCFAKVVVYSGES